MNSKSHNLETLIKSFFAVDRSFNLLLPLRNILLQDKREVNGVFTHPAHKLRQRIKYPLGKLIQPYGYYTGMRHHHVIHIKKMLAKTICMIIKYYSGHWQTENAPHRLELDVISQHRDVHSSTGQTEAFPNKAMSRRSECG